ncbi:MAG: hypothetical protein JSW33_08810 [bacterium]|nr:MAG: hypothetical protein JSW33_08810 [bacterium]
MQGVIGIRRENKDLTERRSPLNPEHVQKLIENYQVRVQVEPSSTRIYSDDEYKAAGASLTADLAESNIIFGVKEIPIADLMPQLAYCYFSHTIKGQSYNMPMLKRLLDLRNTLLDYECVTDEQGRRLIFFGRFAGYAGMINSLWALGVRLKSAGLATPLQELKQAMHYPSLIAAREAIRQIGKQIEQEGLPTELVPMICGFTGYGHVSRGAQEIFDLLPFETVEPAELNEFIEKGSYSNKKLYKVEFKEIDLVQHRNNSPFKLQEYYDFPERYISIFTEYIRHLTLLINGIYWEPRYPRLLTCSFLKEWFREKSQPRLRVIGDITCDVGGSIECTLRATNSLNPVYVYNPVSEKETDGFEGEGILIMAVDKLPSELPREASEMFGNKLLPHIAELAKVDFKQPYEQLQLSAEFKRSIITHQGRLTPNYQYLTKYISKKL